MAKIAVMMHETSLIHEAHSLKARVLVLGAGGAAGAAIARQLARDGLPVVCAGRAAGPPDLPGLRALPWRQVDVLQPATLRAAARDCDVIVHAAHPASYVDWPRSVLPMLDHVLAAVAHSGVTVVLPANVYGLPASAEPLDEACPQPLARTRKGRMRQVMEERLRAAAEAGHCRALLVRAGDFFGGHAPNGWLAQAVLRGHVPAGPEGPVQRIRRICQPGTPGVGHQWAYLPDFARTVSGLLQQRAILPRHAVFHTAGHWDADGQTLVRTLAQLVAQEQGQRPAIRRFPWWALRCTAPVHAMSRELLEMRWLWRQPLRLSNHRLCAALGQGEPHTPWAQALRACL